MGLFDDPEEPETVNALEYLTLNGVDPEKAYHIILHLLLTQSYAFAGELRKAAADLDVLIPFVHPGDGRMH